MRMARVNITIPDDLAAQARAAGLNVSRLAAAAVADELDRRARLSALEAYLHELREEQGPVSDADEATARTWAEQFVAPPPAEPTKASTA